MMTQHITDTVSHSVTRALAAPLSILILIPVLVSGLGLTITLVSLKSARENMEHLAIKNFTEVGSLIHWQVEEILDQGETSLKALLDFSERNGLEFEGATFASEMANQFNNRPALAYLGIGDEQGHYTGIFLKDSLRDQSDLILTVRRMQPSGKTHLREFNISKTPPVLIRDEPDFGYDPRTRPWYLQAKQEGARITSDPYPWYDSGLIGLTIAEPLFSNEGAVNAIIEVDFNLNSFSRQVEQLEARYGTRIMIHSRKGEIIALPGFRQSSGRDRKGKGSVPRIENIEDSLFKNYFSEASSATSDEIFHIEFEQNRERFMAVSRTIDVPGEALWRVVCIGSLDGMLRASRNSMRRNIIVSFVAMLIATGIAFIFARYIVATHVRANLAERDARDAKEEMRALEGYQLLRLLGRGGMGEVWLGEHKMLARPVAIKLIHSTITSGHDMSAKLTTEARFEREARSLAHLESPHTIQIYDFGISDNGDLFYVMELLDGINLRQLVKTFGPQPAERVRRILKDVASSLSEAHEQDLIHRDIKPDNIFISRQLDHLDQVKLLDFGMVRHAGSDTIADGDGDLTVVGAIAGTPAYMAPEQATEEESEVGASADLYCLALVGWYLLTGKNLYARKSQISTLLAQVQDEPPPLSEFSAAGIPEAFGRLLRECLAKNPADRPASAKVLVQRLKKLVAETDPDGTAWMDEAKEMWWKQIAPMDLACVEPDASLFIRHRKSTTSRRGKRSERDPQEIELGSMKTQT